MKLPLLVFVLTSLAGNAQPFLFSEDFDMTGHQFVRSSNIITYDGGNMVATLSNTTNGQRYITLKKTDITGALQWDKRYGPGIDDFQNVVQSAESGYFFNSPGQLIASSTCNDVQCDFDTGNLPPGSYLVRITDEQEVTTRRIVIAD